MNFLQAIATLKAEGFSPQLKSQFSDDELRALQRILSEYEETGNSPTLDSLWADDFERKPVSIDEFLDNDYYMGKIGKSIYPVWRKDLREVLNPLSSVVEWVIKGSIGSGKTYVAALANIYRIYYLQCLKNPQQFYGLAEGSPIVFGLFSIFKYLVGATSYQYFLTWLRDMSPYFADLRGDHHKPKKKLTDAQVFSLPKNVSLALGASSIHALGQNIIGGLCDETEFGKAQSITDKDKSQVATLYHSVKMRMESRFMQRGGTNPGLLCLVSSARNDEQFLSKHVRKKADDPTTFVSHYALYDVKVDRYKDSPRFRVAIGNRFRPSFLPRDDEQVPEDMEVIEVPSDFRHTFEYDTDEAIRDIAGRETYGSRVFLPQRLKLRACIENSTPRKHPFRQEEVTLSLQEDIFIEDYFVPDEMIELWDKTNKLYRPKFFSFADRYIHVDLAKNKDCAGLAMSCISDVVDVDRVASNGLKTRARDYKYFIDFMLRIRAARGSEIDFGKIRRFIFFLVDTCKFRVREVTFDSYQSVDSVQIFNKEKIPAREFSLDRKPGPYRSFKQIILEERLDVYDYDPFYEEMTKLEDHTDDGGKVDHPVGGSKDVSDAACGAVNGALLAKGVQVTGTDAERAQTRANSYAAQNEERAPLHSQEWVKQSSTNSNPLDRLFNKGR